MQRALGLIAIATLAACRGSDPPPAVADAAPQRPADAGATATASAAAAVAVPATPCPDEEDDDEAAAAAAHDKLTLVPASFADLPGWADDRHAEAVPPLLASCERLAELDDDAPVGHDGFSGRARSWRHACAAARKLPAGDHAAARAFFEAEFAPYAAHGEDGPDGKMTAYNVQRSRASRTRHGRYVHPLYGRPTDLLSVDLSKFIKDARGRRIWGRVDPATGTLVAYPTRAEIRRGALDGQGLEILWLDDPVDALFTHIEGSGKARLDDGSKVWIEFAGKNGRSYRGVGRLLRDTGELAKGEGTMQGIRAWFDAHPDRVDEIIDQNASMVFFKISERPGAVGSQGVILTAGRSMAIDRAFVAHSTPTWVDTRTPIAGTSGSEPWRHLVIAQDTGGGILGAVRGDLYMGDDEAAADIAGRMGGAGRYWLLLPRAVEVR